MEFGLDLKQRRQRVANPEYLSKARGRYTHIHIILGHDACNSSMKKKRTCITINNDVYVQVGPVGVASH